MKFVVFWVVVPCSVVVGYHHFFMVDDVPNV